MITTSEVDMKTDKVILKIESIMRNINNNQNKFLSWKIATRELKKEADGQ